MEEIFSPAEQEYERAKKSARAEDIIRAINVEEGIYFRLLTEHYDDCTLFFSRSDGSSVEWMLNELMERKTKQTIAFFTEVYGKAPNEDAIRLLIQEDKDADRL